MSLPSLFHRRPALTGEQRRAITHWRSRACTGSHVRLAEARFVVVDVETTGLDQRADRLISIGAVAIEHSAILIGRTLDVVLKQPAPSAVDNILVHRIGGTEQMSGMEPADALLGFLDFVGNDPIAGFNAAFDRAMIDRALRGALGVQTRNLWLDASPLARALMPHRIPPEQSLDAWCAIADITNYQRHHALADALATAQLWLVLLATAPTQGVDTIAQIVELESGQRWLERTGAVRR